MDYIILTTYSNYVEAHIAKGMLEEQNICCWLKDEYTVTIDPVLTNAIGGIKIMVPRVQAERAAGILASLREEQKRALCCPRCGSHNVELVSSARKPLNWISALSTFFLGDYALTVEKMQHCFACNYEFPENKSDPVS